MSYYNYSPERISRKDFFGNPDETTSSMVPNIIAGSDETMGVIFNSTPNDIPSSTMPNNTTSSTMPNNTTSFSIDTSSSMMPNITTSSMVSNITTSSMMPNNTTSSMIPTDTTSSMIPNDIDNKKQEGWNPSYLNICLIAAGAMLCFFIGPALFHDDPSSSRSKQLLNYSSPAQKLVAYNAMDGSPSKLAYMLFIICVIMIILGVLGGYGKI